MTAVILDGIAHARNVYAGLQPRIASLRARGMVPGLAAVRVGDNPGSVLYVRNKARACAAAGLHSEVIELDAQCSEHAVLEKVEKLNRNPLLHGIIVQLPLPRTMDPGRILQAISPAKDVDGFGWRSLGALVSGSPVFIPGTPLGVMTILDQANIPVEGKTAVVIGRSTIVGKPMALLFIGRGATVTVCHSRTADLGRWTRNADILVAAAGRPALVQADMIKRGAVVIDVGINRLADGKITGDVDPGAREIASHLTPVPGGVGPMTVAMLIANTVLAAERSATA
jgi:methylenetetrahydrofolate dehydrogenase (NADP+) / methenyltetrahydrofolate cyclohydrolase